MNRTDLVWCACVVRKGLTIHCGRWGLSCCLLSRAGGNRIRVPNFRTSGRLEGQIIHIYIFFSPLLCSSLRVWSHISFLSGLQIDILAFLYFFLSYLEFSLRTGALALFPRAVALRFMARNCSGFTTLMFGEFASPRFSQLVAITGTILL